jgi:outer membrane lipoprotein carrier protein
MKAYKGWVIVSFCLSVAAFAATAKKKPEEVQVNELVEKLQKYWDSAKTYRANFVQVVYAKRLGTRDETEGILYVSKPGRLRWESKSDPSFQIMDGKKLMYVHSNKRRGTTVVDILEDTTKTVDAKALQFLAGTGNFKDSYKVTLVTDKPKVAEIKLVPKGGGSESYIAEINKSSYGIESLTTESGDTRAKIKFSDVKTNVELDEKLFKYEPKPTDIIHKGG